MSDSKSKPLTKDEVALLIQLVDDSKVINNKGTNAVNKQLKDKAWENICNNFNAAISTGARKISQLRLKWENLKKAARKRSAQIRMNNIKTGGGKPDYIPPDDALDRVASILGATCDGYEATVGGDAEPEKSASEVPEVACSSSSGGIPLEGNIRNTFEQRRFFFNTSSGNSGAKQKRKQRDDEVKARTERDTAIANYYKLKSERIRLELDLLKKNSE